MEGKEVARLVLLGLGILLLLQLVPFGWKRTNPPVVSEPVWSTEEGRLLFDRACADCHSNRTRWPWYSYVAPISWLVIHDVDEGRKHLNVSEWHRPQKDAREAAEVVREGEMPLLLYRIAHREARLTSEERNRLILALETTFGTDEKREDSDRGVPRTFEAPVEDESESSERVESDLRSKQSRVRA